MIQLHGVLQQQAAAGFNPQTAIGWHSFFWAEGTAFKALAYADTAAVGTWPNETGETNATEATNRPTYKAANTAYNSKPTVNFPSASSRLKAATFSVAPSNPISIVVIGNFGAVTATWYIVDGSASSNRAAITASGTKWGIYNGAVVDVTTSDANPHLFNGYFRTGSNDTLGVDGTTVIDADAGSHTITGLTIGNHWNNAISSQGGIAMVGVYQGDIKAHGQWSAFKTWAGSHYSLTIA